MKKAKKTNVQDIYPLSPLQEGLLFHAIYEPEAGLYLDQLVMRLRTPGGLDGELLKRVWSRLLERHEVLRTAFTWQRRDRPLQVVLRRVKLEIGELDGRGGGSEAERLEALLEHDREQGFDLSKAPLLRLARVRLRGGEPGEEILVLTYHHILMDAWSLSLVLREFFALYEAALEGREVELPAPRPYRAFIAWLRRQDPEAAEAFWRRELAAWSAPTPLGIDRLPAPRGGRPPGYADQVVGLGEELSARLESFARRQRLTPNHLVRGAWALVLSRCGGEPEVVFGATVSGRPDDLQGVETMVGLFINTLPVRVGCGPERRVESWLGGIRDQQVEQRQFEYSSLVDVHGWSGVPRDAPLFETLLVFENVPGAGLEGRSGGQLELRDLHYEPKSGYALTAMVIPGADLKLRLLYPRERFDATTVGRVLGHFRHLVAELVAKPAARLGELSLLGRAERHQLAVEWQDNERRAEGDPTIHELFEARARRHPERTAVVGAGGEELSYGELEAEANRLAHRLRASGVVPGETVAVLLGRSPRMVVAVLGILKAGAAYVPLELAHPPGRWTTILDTLGAAAAVTEGDSAEALSVLETRRPLERVISLDRDRDALEREPATALATPLGAEAIAYTIFTSGSTGTPKGVVVRHRPVVNLIDWVGRTHGMGTGDRVLFVTALSFDLSVYDVFGLLAAGGSIRIASEAEIAEPRRLLACLVEEPITFWDSAPAALQQLVPFFPEVRGVAAGARLRRVFLSGDWVPLTLPGALAETFPGARLTALGGATEATVWSNHHEVAEVAPDWASIPYGRPIDNARYHVLDPRLEPCPVGVPGDLFIGGRCLASGYAGEPATSAEKFIPDPFAARPGSRLYRTGDRSRFWPGGMLEFLGRLDHQVKIRGFRIELGEIESALAEHPALESAVVLAPGGRGERRLVAFGLVGGGAEPDREELRQYLARTLPEYMVPASWIFLESFPVTANGKLDRDALAALAAETAAPSGGRRRARTPTEELVVGLWGEVLGVGEVGPEDGFFDLGGHSLLATQVISRVRETFDVELPLRSLFEAPSAAHFAREIEAARGTATPKPPIERLAPATPAPLSFSQERLWFLSRLDTENTAYKLPSALRFTGELDVAALEAALAEVVRRHDALRTVLVEAPGEPAQAVSPEAAPELVSIDLMALSAEDRGRALDRGLERIFEAPFDLYRGPLLRIALLRSGEGEHVLATTLHHFVSDAWSMAIFASELIQLYGAATAGKPSPLAELPYRYAEFALWQRRWLRAEVLEAQLDYWRRELDPLPKALRLPGARPRPRVLSFRGKMESRLVGGDDFVRLVDFARSLGATLFMASLAAFKVMLALLTGERDVAVGSDIANRHYGEFEGLIGYFANVVVLRTDLSGDLDFRGVIQRVRETAMGAYAHQDVPFEKLTEALGLRSGEGTTLFQVKFVFQEMPAVRSELEGIEIEAVEGGHGAANFDLTLFVTPEAEQLNLDLEYNTDIYGAESAARLLDHYEKVLRRMVEEPKTKLGNLSLLEHLEQRELAASFSEDLE